MESLKKINKKLAKGAANNSTEFLNSFLDKEDDLLSLLKNFRGTRSEAYLNEINGMLTDEIKFSSLFSDLTIVNTAPSSINPYHITCHDAESKYFRERQLTIPAEHIHETGIDPKRFLPCYIHRNDSETKSLFKQFSSLVKSERLIIRPLRGLYVNFPEKKEGSLYYVDPNTSNDHWYINKIRQSDSIFIDNGYLPYKESVDIFNITLPYFKNISVDGLSKILDEENEHLVHLEEIF